ncbi:MAG TPA: cytochrome c oxidase assembly protein [Terriglobales bacterium]|nr:cytochrome c oxidase assembly protein [Terriglobales bacterium]
MKGLSHITTFLIGPFLLSEPAWADSRVPQITLASWTWPLEIVIPLFLFGVLYIIGFYKLRRISRSAQPQLSQAFWFGTGWLSLLIALDSPLHELSEQLFWVHMTQHEILMIVSAPLLVMSRPLVPLLWSLPRRWRIQTGHFGKTRVSKTIWLALSAPACAWLLHAVSLWIWHLPVLFDATLTNDLVHASQHISFLGTALLFWWALIHGHGGRLSYGGAVLYVFTTALHMSLLSALLTFSPRAWYAPYVLTAPTWHLTALQDQQLGGLIMWVPAGTVLLIVTLVLFKKWLEDSDRRWEYTRTANALRTSALNTDGK